MEDSELFSPDRHSPTHPKLASCRKMGHVENGLASDRKVILIHQMAGASRVSLWELHLQSELSVTQ